MSATFPIQLYPGGCPCFTCLKEIGEGWKMALCPVCGSKRCKGSRHHVNHCEASE